MSALGRAGVTPNRAWTHAFLECSLSKSLYIVCVGIHVIESVKASPFGTEMASIG